MFLLSSAVCAAGSVTYTSEKHGFLLTPPAQWKGHKALEKEAAWSGSVTGPVVYFCLPATGSVEFEIPGHASKFSCQRPGAGATWSTIQTGCGP